MILFINFFTLSPFKVDLHLFRREVKEPMHFLYLLPAPLAVTHVPCRCGIGYARLAAHGLLRHAVAVTRHADDVLHGCLVFPHVHLRH